MKTPNSAKSFKTSDTISRQKLQQTFANRAQRKEEDARVKTYKERHNLWLSEVKALSLTSAAFGNNTGEPPTGVETAALKWRLFP